MRLPFTKFGLEAKNLAQRQPLVHFKVLADEHHGVIQGYEFKWNPGAKVKLPTDFLAGYPGSKVVRIDRSNYWQFLLS